MDWEDRISVKKGNIGESIVRKHLESKNYIIYEPVTKAAHPIDKIAIRNKEHMILVEVKSKARLNKFNATGLDIRNFKYYKLLKQKYNMPLFVFFVDEYLKTIYGNKLSILEEKHIDKQNVEYPNTNISKGIILFSLEKMNTIHNLTELESKMLKMFSERNYQYNIF